MITRLQITALCSVFLSGVTAFAQDITNTNLQSTHRVFSGQPCGYIDSKTKQEVISRKYNSCSDFSDGSALVGVASEHGYLYGFVNSKGEEIIPLQYSHASDFSDSLAAVSIQGKTGFIDITGKVAIEPKFDFAGSFYNGYAEVFVDRKAGIIDKNGDYIITPQFSRITHFSGDVFLAQEGEVNLFYYNNKTSPENLASKYGAKVYKGGLYSLSKGWLTEQKYMFGFSFQDKDTTLISASIAEEYGRGKGEWPLYGLMKLDGTWKIPPRFKSINIMSEDRIITSGINEKVQDKDNRFFSTVLNLSGDELFSFSGGNFEEIGDSFLRGLNPKIFKDGYAIFVRRWHEDRRSLSAYGMVDRSGNLVSGQWYDHMKRPMNRTSVVRVRNNNDKNWQGLSLDGKTVQDPDDNAVLLACSSGLKLVTHSENPHMDRLDIVGIDGHSTLPESFSISSEQNNRKLPCDRILSYSVRTSKNGYGYSFIDINGRPLNNEIYSKVWDFNEQGYAIVKKGSSYGRRRLQDDQVYGAGIIDQSGNYSALIEYDFLRDLGENRYYASKDYRKFYIDQNGNEIPEPKSSPSSERANGLKCFNKDWTAKAKEKNGIRLWGIADAKENWVVNPSYRAINCTVGDTPSIIWGSDDSARQWCPVKTSGFRDYFTKCKPYVISMGSHRSSHLAMEQFSDDPYENSVLWQQALLNYSAGFRYMYPLAQYTAGSPAAPIE